MSVLEYVELMADTPEYHYMSLTKIVTDIVLKLKTYDLESLDVEELEEIQDFVRKKFPQCQSYQANQIYLKKLLKVMGFLCTAHGLNVILDSIRYKDGRVYLSCYRKGHVVQKYEKFVNLVMDDAEFTVCGDKRTVVLSGVVDEIQIKESYVYLRKRKLVGAIR